MTRLIAMRILTNHGFLTQKFVRIGRFRLKKRIQFLGKLFFAAE